jgi:hypothetical protein
VAGLLKSPEFELDPAEAKMLAENMTLVASQYSVEVNPKYMAWMALIGCLLAIYGPRFGAVFVKKQIQGNKPKPVQQEAPQQGGLKAVPMEPFYPPQSFTG